MLRLLVRHLPRAGLRHALPRPRAGHGAGRRRSTRRGSSTGPTSTRTSRSRSPCNAFLAWVGRYPRVYHLGHGRKAVTKRYQQLRASSSQAPGQTAGSAPTSSTTRCSPPPTATAPTRTSPTRSPALAEQRRRRPVQAVLPASQPDRARVPTTATPPYLATECTDAAVADRLVRPGSDDMSAPPQECAVPHLVQRLVQRPVPHLAGGLAPRRVDVTGAGLDAVPILLLSETHDPATPYAGALAARKHLPDVARWSPGVGGYSHSTSLFGIACTDLAIAARAPGRLAAQRASPATVRTSGARAAAPTRPRPPTRGRAASAPMPHRTWWASLAAQASQVRSQMVCSDSASFASASAGQRVGGVGDDVPLLAAGGEVLPGDVVAAVGEDPVHVGQHPGDVECR